MPVLTLKKKSETLRELSVCCIFPGSKSLLGKFKNHPDREVRELASTLPGLILQDMAPSSVKKYQSTFFRWVTWARSKSISSFPADAMGVSLYLALQTRLCSSLSAFNSIVYGIAWAHHKMCFPVPTDDPMAKQVVKEGRRILGKSAINRKLPLQQDQERALVHKYIDASLPDLQIVTLTTLGFFGFLRWDDLSQLRFSDLFFYHDHLALFLEKRKNDQFREGSWIYIAISKGSPCPVRLTKHFLKAGGHKGNEYLFRRVSHTKSGYTLRHHKLSYTRALELVRVQLKSIGLEPEKYGLHSMRSGGASLAAALGIPDRLIMRKGGWKSEEPKNNYIKETRDTLLHISRACMI